MSPLIFAASVLVFGAVAWNDLAHRSIPNLLPLAVLGLAILRFVVAPPPGELLYTFLAALAAFCVTLFLFSRGWFGGGDVKLLSATILLVGARDAMTFLLLMALAGGVLSVLVVAWTFVGRWRARRQATVPNAPDVDGDDAEAPMTVPYGVAIAAAAVLVLFPQLLQG